MQYNIMAPNIQNLPEEILLYMFLFLDDTDLQTMTKVSPFCKRLASDLILWKKFRLVKNSAIITSRLFRDTRPDRVHLVNRNVLRGVHPQQIRTGQYINSPSLQILHENQTKIHWLLREQTIKRRLGQRPDAADLRDRNVMPNDVNSAPEVSPALIGRANHLKKALKQAVLHRKLVKRRELQEVQPVMKGTSNRMASSLVATKVELEKQFTKDGFRRKLDSRPTLPQVENMMIDQRQVALMVCPGVKPKIRSFERASSLSSSL